MRVKLFSVKFQVEAPRWAETNNHGRKKQTSEMIQPQHEVSHECSRVVWITHYKKFFFNTTQTTRDRYQASKTAQAQQQARIRHVLTLLLISATDQIQTVSERRDDELYWDNRCITVAPSIHGVA